MSIASQQDVRESGHTRHPVSVEDLAGLLADRYAGNRMMVAVAGPPGSGKSTTSGILMDMLIDRHRIRTQIVALDGFQYDNAVLAQLGLADRKGAPETFDVDGMASLLARLSDSTDDAVAVPVFDREIDVARAGARLVEPDTRILLVEGHYLLLREARWSHLRTYLDCSAMIVSDEASLRARLMRRWLDLGFSYEASEAKLEQNDLPNAMRVFADSVDADYDLLW